MANWPSWAKFCASSLVPHARSLNERNMIHHRPSQNIQTHTHITANWLNMIKCYSSATVDIQAKISRDELQPKMILRLLESQFASIGNHLLKRPLSNTVHQSSTAKFWAGKRANMNIQQFNQRSILSSANQRSWGDPATSHRIFWSSKASAWVIPDTSHQTAPDIYKNYMKIPSEIP